MKGKCSSNRFYTTNSLNRYDCSGKSRKHTDLDFLSTWIENEVGELTDEE